MWALLIYLHGVWRYLRRECSLAHIFMLDEERNILLLDEVKTLYKEQSTYQEVLRLKKEQHFSEFCDGLQSLYKEEKKSFLKLYVEPFINQYPFLEEASSLQVIGKIRYETYHSLFLKYIWDSHNILGPQILKCFLSILGREDDWIESLRDSAYRVCEEVQTKGLKKGDDRKRIDLLFVDDKNDWCIVVENKIDSEVHYSIGTRKQSQLDYYYRFCEKEYKEHQKLYILLTYNPRNTFHQKGEWILANYYQVFESLLKYHSEDALIRDYLKSLFKLLFPHETMAYYKVGTLHRGIQFYNNIISNIK